LSALTGGVPQQTQETVLYSFVGGSNGENPYSDLTDVNFETVFREAFRR
jgi:hypothetical protein